MNQAVWSKCEYQESFCFIYFPCVKRSCKQDFPPMFRGDKILLHKISTPFWWRESEIPKIPKSWNEPIGTPPKKIGGFVNIDVSPFPFGSIFRLWDFAVRFRWGLRIECVGRIIATETRFFSPQKVAVWKGNARLFQGNLGSWHIIIWPNLLSDRNRWLAQWSIPRSLCILSCEVYLDHDPTFWMTGSIVYFHTIYNSWQPNRIRFIPQSGNS